jgi:hypothetical protein
MSGSILPLKTYVNADTPLFGTGSGGGAVSTFTDLTCSTILVQDCFIGFGDGTHLSTIGGQLYYDNELVASLSSISSIGDWSLLPAISTVDMAGNSISSIGVAETSSLLVHGPDLASFISGTAQPLQAELAFGQISGGRTAQLLAGGDESHFLYADATSTFGKLGLSSTLQGAYILDQGNNAYTFTGGLLSAPAGAFSTLYTNNLSTQTFTAVSTTVVQETISSLNIVADFANFSTLWGQPSSFYFSPVSSISSLSSETITCSTLVAQTRVSTADLEVSSINGHEFTENTATISTIFSNNISSVFGDFQFTLLSTLQFSPSFDPSLDVNLGLGSLFGNLAGAATGALGVVVGGAALGTGIAALTQSRQTNNLGSPSSFELVNGTTQLQVSTLGSQVSSIFRFVSSLNDQTPGQEFFASTIIPAGTVCIRSVSDPLNTVSSPQSTIQYFGQWVSMDEVVPPASTISTFNQLFTSSIRVSTVAFPNGTSLRVGVPWANAGGVSTTELFWNDAVPPLDADFRVGALVITGSDVGGINYSKDVLIQNQNAGNRLIVYPNASTIAFLSDIPAITSSFQDLGTNDLRVSTINMEGTGQILWDNGASIYEVGANQLFLTAGNATQIDLQPAQIIFNEGGIGGQMRFFDNHLEVSAISTLSVQALQGMSASTLTVSSINNLPYPPPGTFTTANVSSLKVSSIGDIGTSSLSFTNANLSYMDLNNAGDIIGVATNYVNFQAQGTGGQLAGFIANAGGLGSWSNYATGPMFLNASTIRMSTAQVQMTTLSTPQIINLSSLQFRAPGPAYTLSSLINIVPGAGGASQTSTLLQVNTDLSVGTGDIICGQVRVGGTGSGVAEIVMTGPDGFIQAFDRNTADITLRSRLGTNPAVSTGYILDTYACPPFFSTINNQVNLMSYFPSTTANTIGFSTLSKMNPVSLYGRSTLAGGALTVVFNPPYADSNEYSVLLTYQDTAGGNPLHANILSVSSFSANGNGTNNFFWQTIGRV